MGRKAASQENVKRMETPAFIGIILVVGVVVIAGAVFLGKSDGGQIDVTATIQNSNRLSVDAEGNPTEQVATVGEALRSMPNGGLVSQTETPAPQPEAIPPETASSSETSATSTGEEGTGPETPRDETEAETLEVQ